MAENTSIQWTDHTLNFWWGCLKVSPGCHNCYASALSKRTGRDIWGPAETTERWRTKGPWANILKWQKKAAETGERKKVFTMSMGDFFEDHPMVEPWRKEAIEIIEQCPNLDFQLLTKRPENVYKMAEHWFYGWPDNVWIGTSIENQQVTHSRIDALLDIPARVRFLSMEPLLETVSLDGPFNYPDDPDATPWLSGIDWIIAGGESGHGARPMPTEALDLVIEQCQEWSVPLFVKQMGEVLARQMELKDKKGGDLDEWPDCYQIRQFPAVVND